MTTARGWHPGGRQPDPARREPAAGMTEGGGPDPEGSQAALPAALPPGPLPAGPAPLPPVPAGPGRDGDSPRVGPVYLAGPAYESSFAPSGPPAQSAPPASPVPPVPPAPAAWADPAGSGSSWFEPGRPSYPALHQPTPPAVMPEPEPEPEPAAASPGPAARDEPPIRPWGAAQPAAHPPAPAWVPEDSWAPDRRTADRWAPLPPETPVPAPQTPPPPAAAAAGAAAVSAAEPFGTDPGPARDPVGGTGPGQQRLYARGSRRRSTRGPGGADHGRPATAADTSTRAAAALAWARRWYLRDVLVAWIAARAVVGAALALTRFVADTVAGDNGATLDTTDLLGWDAGWYLNIADNGYDAAGVESRRFFPLLPLLVRLFTALPGLGGHSGQVLLVLVNLIAVLFALALVGIARVEGFDDDTVRRVIWISALAPPAFVLVMGYAEALAGLLAVTAFLGARTRRWELAMAAGLLGGLCRPLGLLLVVPVAIEAARGLPLPLARRLGAPPPDRLGATSPDRSGVPPPPRAAATEALARLCAVAAPAAGAGIYLLWSAVVHGDGLAPLTMQRDAARHGSTANPLLTVVDAAKGALHGELGTALHVPWLLLAVVALVVMARALPVSYCVWSGLVLAAVLTGSNLDSSERYLYGAFPFLLVAALVTARREMWMLVITVSTAAMTVYATLAFTLSYVP
ncbi:mannosyltransferase family protein [Parafrankia discariae]|uniref:mannosyltransferase family protein n=1 Tax=Parafrankia discariae TaxID=365528 RepID=UPI0003A503A3|nr:mannosyltransferase family protein [Parafrankia discariae]